MSTVAVGFPGTAAAQESTLDEMDGSGTEEDPYVVTNVDELQAMNEDRDAHYVLGNDIDASDTENWNDGAGFDPVGDDENKFTGSFDGQNHSISGLTVNRPTEGFAGLIGVSDGTVEHLSLVDASMVGTGNVGTVVGANNGGTIRNVHASGTVDGEVTVGGLVGGNNGRIVMSGAAVEVDAEKRNSGGLVGTQADGTLTQSYASGDVTANKVVGGLVGSAIGGEMQSVYAMGDVDTTRRAGGLIGENQGTSVVEAYSTGTVTAEYNVGGLVGWVETRESIQRTYTTSSVAGTDDSNGRYGNVAGQVLNDDPFTDIYYDTDEATLEKTVGTGGDDVSDGAITGVSTDEMQGTAARENMDALNFGPAWTATDEYPVHNWAVENVSFSLKDTRVARGNATDATVTLDLADGRTVTATETASYETNNSVASVSDGTVETTETGTVNVTASIAGETKTETLEVLEPPNISATAASIDEDLVAQGVTVPIETTVVNTGDIAGEDTVDLRVDGETVTEVTVSGEPGDEQNVTVDWEPESLGSFDVAVDDASAGTVEVVEPPELTTETASTNVSAVSAGASVPVSATIANDDRLRGARNTTLSVDGENVTSEEVSVDADNETTTSLDWTPEQPGTYDLAVDGVDAGTVEVVPADSVAVENVSTPENATAGESFDANVTVNNTADITVSERLRLTSGGETVGATRAELPANETTTVTVSGVVADAGETTLSAESTSSSASADLSVLEPASFAITELDTPSSVTAGESDSVTATVENQGGVAGSQTVALSLDGEEVTSETVELAAGGSTTVSGDISPSSAGESQVTAETDDDNQTATVTVEAASTPTESGGTDTSSGSGPGFGVAAALLALLAGAALRRRR
ncbi:MULTISPECIES: CARDB domain-containing protein [Haloarcula]|uniref:CARDB domain-containing protein n=1 Tax=Haloarcula TaxID=2237 RepID=UPI0023E816BE|nr:CARDB domain-containing protein [Halomicroarcula sp. SHR3]